MKLYEILTEATDVSEFGIDVYRHAIPNTDRYLRKYFAKVLDKAKKQNPNDYATEADKIIKDMFGTEGGPNSPHMIIKSTLQKHLTKELQKFIEKRFGHRFNVGQYRLDATPTNAHVEFFHHIPNSLGQYNRIHSPGGYDVKALAVQIALSNSQWKNTWSDWFSDFVSGNSTQQDIKNRVDSVINTIIHEVTHLVNDIQGDTHHNTSHLKHGKAYHDYGNPHLQQVVDKVGANILHLSRTSEIQTFASEIAWELAQDVLTNSGWNTAEPEEKQQQIDDIISDVAKGYHNSAILYTQQDMINKVKEIDPKNKKQLNKIWKSLLKQVVKNLELYKKRIGSTT